MATLASLLVKLGVDTRAVKPGLEKGTKDAEAQGRRTGQRWGRGFGSAVRIGLTAAGVAGSFQFLAGQVRDSVSAYAEAQAAQTQLSDAFARFPKLADTSIQRLRDLNETLMAKTRFDDDAFASGQAILAQYGLTGRQLEAITPLLADYAAKTGKNVPDAAKLLGKAFLGNVRALKDLGINYKSTGDLATDTANITKLLGDRVAGFAAKEGKTAAGQAAILANRYGELKERVGGELLPVLTTLAGALIAVVGFVEKNADVLGPLAAIIGVVTLAQIAWNIAMSANPLGLIIIGIALLIAGIVLLVKHWDTVWGFIKETALKVGRWFRDVLWGQWIKGAWDAILGAGKAVARWFSGLPPMFKALFIKVATFITAPFRGAFNLVAKLWNSTIGSLSWTVPGWVPIIGGNTISAPKLPTFHSGGIMPGTGEGLAMLTGGEGIFTPEQMRALGGGAGGGRTVLEIRGDGSATADFLLELLRHAVRVRGGNVQVVIGRKALPA